MNTVIGRFNKLFALIGIVAGITVLFTKLDNVLFNEF